MLGWLIVLDWVKLAFFHRLWIEAGRPHWYTRFLRKLARRVDGCLGYPGDCIAHDAGILSPWPEA